MLLPLLLLALTLASDVTTHSWPHWGGPNRDFSVAADEIGWTGATPHRAWSRDLGEGYSAVVGDTHTVFTAFRRGGTMIVTAIDAGTGRTRWEHPLSETSIPNMFLDYGPGPNSTPALADGRLFVVTFTGQLHALDSASGQMLWRRDLWGDLKGTFRDVGYSNSPLLFRDLVVLPVGGNGRGLAAFRQRDGEIVWMASDLENAMSSPIAIDVAGQTQIVCLMVEGVAGFDPADGTQLWFHPHRTQYDVNAATPVWHQASGTLIVSSAYDAGARAIRLTRTGSRTTASEVWFSRRLRVHHGNLVVLGDHVYGSNGDFGPAPLTAVDVRTGHVAWQSRTFPKVTMVQAGSRTIVLDEDGRLAIAVLAPSGLQVLQQAEVTSRLSWTPPTLIGTRLYIRDRRSLVALDLVRSAG